MAQEEEVEPPSVSGVYLLHFDEPVGHALHYCGWAEDMKRRIDEHRRGVSGAVLPRAAFIQGIGFTVSRVWVGATRGDEMRLKKKSHRPPSPAMRNTHKNGRGSSVKVYCPICHPNNRRGVLAP